VKLIELIVERICVRDNQVVAMTLRSNFHLVLGHNVKEPTEFSVAPRLWQFEEACNEELQAF